MQNDNERDAELDRILGPLGLQSLSDSAVVDLIARARKSRSHPSAQKWWLPLTFAAGAAVGISGTLFFSQTHSAEPSVVQFEQENSEEFATVRQIITNY